ncbi:MAG TPA: ADP-ribosyltransferase [Mucilaginibacter sp.]|jgi:hypothetical protein
MKIFAVTKLLQYVITNCSREFEEVKSRNISDVLSFEEQAIIYKYTEDGYERLNERLRISKGKEFSQFGKFLDKALAKLPNYEDVTYRAVDLTNTELQKYIDAKENNSILVEHSFISASKSKAIANGFGKSCRFRIFSRSGKNIEEFAKYGINHPQNEKEILFRPNSRFKVLEVTKYEQYTLITLEESKK